MKVGAANVRELYFKHQDLTRINGKQTLAALHNIALHLKINAGSILCTLCGGVYSYIGIGIFLVAYATTVPMNSFIVPDPLGPLNVTNNATQYQIALTTAFHEMATHTLRTYQLVQCAIIHQVLEALEAKYLTRL